MDVVVTPAMLVGLAGRAISGASGPLASSVIASRGYDAVEKVDALVGADKYLLMVLARLHSKASSSSLDRIAAFLQGSAADVIVRAVFVASAIGQIESVKTIVVDDLTAVLVTGNGVSPEDASIASEAIVEMVSHQIEDRLQGLKKANRHQYLELLHRAQRESESGYVSSLRDRSRLVQGMSPERLVLVQRFLVNYSNLIHSHTSELVPAYIDTQRRVPIESSYVRPQLVRITAEGSADAGEPVRFEAFRASVYRTVVLGDPGGGKSTLAQKLTYDLTGVDNASSAVPRLVPFVVVVRDYERQKRQGGGSIVAFLEMNILETLQIEPPSGAVEFLLAAGKAMVTFDGLDELMDLGGRRVMCDAIESFARRFSQVSIIVTSRRVGYREAPVSPTMFESWRLVELSVNDVSFYVKAWFQRDSRLSLGEQRELAASFMRESEDVRDLRVNPLMLGLLCNIYRRRRQIPRNRAELYNKCAEMLFDLWDAGRGIAPGEVLKENARATLQHVALWAFTDPKIQGGNIPENALRRRMADYLVGRSASPDAALDTAKHLLGLWKGRAWILTDVGSNPDANEAIYRFTHRTFLEYFAAIELVKKNPRPRKLWSVLRPQVERGGWTIVAQVAIQTLDQSFEDGGDLVVRSALDSLVTGIDSSRPIKFGDLSLGSNSRGSNESVLAFLAEGLETFRASSVTVRAVVIKVVDFVLDSTERRVLSPNLDDSRIEMPALGYDSRGLLMAILSHPGDISVTVSEEIARYLESVFSSGVSLRSAVAGALLLDGEAFGRINSCSGWSVPAANLGALIVKNARYYPWLPVVGLRSGKIDAGVAFSLAPLEAVFCTYSLFDTSHTGKRSGESIAEEYVRDTVSGRRRAAENSEFALAVQDDESERIFPSLWYSLGSTLFDQLFSDVGKESHASRGAIDLTRPEQLTVAGLLLAFIAEIEDWPMYNPITGEVVSLDLGALSSVAPFIRGRRVPGEDVTGDEVIGLKMRASAASLLLRWSRRQIDMVGVTPDVVGHSE